MILAGSYSNNYGDYYALCCVLGDALGTSQYRRRSGFRGRQDQPCYPEGRGEGCRLRQGIRASAAKGVDAGGVSIVKQAAEVQISTRKPRNRRLLARQEAACQTRLTSHHGDPVSLEHVWPWEAVTGALSTGDERFRCQATDARALCDLQAVFCRCWRTGKVSRVQMRCYGASHATDTSVRPQQHFTARRRATPAGLVPPTAFTP